MEGKIKVVWICHFSNENVRKRLEYSKFYYQRYLSAFLHKPILKWNDFAVWNTNALKIFEQFEDVDLTVIFPYAGIRRSLQRFDYNGVHYAAYRSEDDNLLHILKERFIKSYRCNYYKNRSVISQIIRDVRPDVVHVIGAENPYYSIAALDVPDDIPTIVSLQTLMSDPNFQKNYFIRSQSTYEFRSKLEAQIIQKCTFIGSKVDSFKSIIKKLIKEDAIFLNMTLALGVDIDNTPCNKEYDFVYFAANISKACDYAIEAFALACKKHPGLTLNVSGGYQTDYKARLEARLLELGLLAQVHFTGPKASHDEVLKQIKKSRFAILPLKVDLVSGTIREAMACGLPVVTTITPATPKLNEDRESVLLSEKGEFQAMADNMIRLVEDELLANKLKENAIMTVRERYSNEHFMKIWHDAYFEILDNLKNGTPFSDEIL